MKSFEFDDKSEVNFRLALTGQLLLLFTLILLTAFASSCGSSKGSNINTDNPESAYLQAKARYDKGDYYDAIEDFNSVKLKFSGSSIIDKAVYYLAMSYYKREEYILADYEFESLVKNYPSSKFVEDSRYMVAMCYYGLSPEYSLDQTYTRYAINEFQNFIELYPSSRYSGDVEKRINELKTKLAYKDLKSAELYFTLGNYKSALVYYNDILDQYYDTKYADDALYGKIRTLIAKKRFDDAGKEISRFEDKYPTSSLLSKVRSLKNNLH